MAGKEKTVSIQLTYDQLQLLKTWGKTESTLKKQARKMKRIGQQMSLAISAPLGLAAVAAIKQFATFEQSMAKVQAVSGATAKEFEMLTAKALELGRSTIFTAQEVANLELQYSKLGFSASEIDKITKATLDLALVTGEDLARSAEVAGSTLRGFNLDASEMPRVVDVMAKAFTSSALDLEKFQVSISKIAPIAAATGRSIEEVTAAESVLADTGIEASIIGTSLRKIFGDLAKEGMTYKEAMDQIRNSTDPVVTATKLFDIRAAAAAVSLAFQDEKLNRLIGTYKRAGGTTEELSEIMNDTLMVDLKELQSAVQGLGIKFGQVLSPAVREMTDLFTALASKIGDLSASSRLYISLVGLTVMAIPPVLIAIGSYQLAISSLSIAQLRLIVTTKKMLLALGRGTLIVGALVLAYEGLRWAKEKAVKVDDTSLRVIDKLNKQLESQKKLIGKINSLKADGTKESRKATAATLDEAKAKQLYNLELFQETQHKLGLIGAYLTQLREELKEEQSKFGSIKEGTKDIVGIQKLQEKITSYTRLYGKYADVLSNVNSSQTAINEAIAAFNGKKVAGGLTGTLEDITSAVDDLNYSWVRLGQNMLWRHSMMSGTDNLSSGIGAGNAESFMKSFEHKLKDKMGILEFDIPLNFNMDTIWDKIDKTGDKLKELTSSIESMTESAIVEMSSMLGDMLGRALSGQDISGKEFGRGLLEMVAGFMQQLGALMIAFGVEYAVFEKSVISGNAPLAIAAGIAMVAAGAAIKGALSSGVDGSGGGMTTPSYGGGAGGYGGQDFTTEVKIQGREMIIVQSREKSFRR